MAEEKLSCVPASHTIREALGQMDADNYDIAPVDESPTQRYLVRSELRDLPGNGPCITAAHTVDVRHLVTGSLGLAAALDLLLERRFLFVLEGGRISGIITSFDVRVDAIVTAAFKAPE